MRRHARTDTFHLGRRPLGRRPRRPPRHGWRGRLPARRLVADERRLGPGRSRLVGARQQRHAGQLGRCRQPGPGLDPRRLRRLGAALRRRRHRPDPRLGEPRAARSSRSRPGSAATRSPGQNNVHRLQGRDRVHQRRPTGSTRRATAGWPSTSATARTYFCRSPEAPASVWDGKWHNAAGTFDGTTVRLFIDGKEIGNGTPVSTPIAYNPPAGGGLIGDYHGTCDLYIDRRRRRRADLVAGAAGAPTSGAS